MSNCLVNLDAFEASWRRCVFLDLQACRRLSALKARIDLLQAATGIQHKLGVEGSTLAPIRAVAGNRGFAERGRPGLNLPYKFWLGTGGLNASTEESWHHLIGMWGFWAILTATSNLGKRKGAFCSGPGCAPHWSRAELLLTGVESKRQCDQSSA